jgi:hypothetical protein
MRISLVGLNMLALAVLLVAAWLVFEASQQAAPVSDMGRAILLGVFAAGAAGSLAAVIQFSGKRRMRPWNAITPMVVGFLLIVGGFPCRVINAFLPR